MKRKTVFVIVGFIILAFIITGFVGQGKKVSEPKTSVEGRIKTLEAEIAELKEMLSEGKGKWISPVKDKTIPFLGPRAWRDGTRCWVEDGTNMWTSIAPVPAYNVGVGVSDPVGKIESRVVLPGGSTYDEVCYGIKTLGKPGFQDYAYGGYFEVLADNGTPHDYYGVYAYVHGNNTFTSDIKAAVGARSEGNGTGYSYGVFAADSNSERGYGVYGAAIGRDWDAPTLSYGLYGRADGKGGVGGVWISKAYGVYATATTADSTFGIYAAASGGANNLAGYFKGDVYITGSLTKGSGSFLIDHPLDPLNKTLRHNFVESPENLCLYRGKVKLDEDGKGIVRMPDYFAALTKENEATVQLTPIGHQFLVAYEWNKDFSLFTVIGESNASVSYTVYADRDDPVIHQLYRPVEEEKGDGNFAAGELLYPEAYGY